MEGLFESMVTFDMELAENNDVTKYYSSVYVL